MRTFDKHWLLENVAREMIRVCVTTPIYTGADNSISREILERCKAYHATTGTLLIFTRDSGHHTSGWWKNPQYERCWHLSISFRDPLTQRQRDKDIALTERWTTAFFHDNKRYLWAEPPYSKYGRLHGVWHYRVFCDEAWQPIIPKGEVYSKEFTEAGWLSYSDLQHEHTMAQNEREKHERVG